MLAAKAATVARRAQQILRVRELKITRLSKPQLEKLDRMFLEAKWLRNSIVARGVFDYKLSVDGVHVKLPSGELEPRELTILPAHVKQTLQAALQANVKSLASAKKAGRIAGSIRFTDRVNSLEFKTGDVKIEGKRALIPKLGRVRVAGTNQLGDELANARLVRRASGYYLLVTSLSAKVTEEAPKLAPVGLDFGIKTHITVSDGREWNLKIEEPERLRRLQRKLQRQVKGTNNHRKPLRELNRCYERLSNLKEEAAYQIVASLKDQSLVAFQDENLRGWKAQRGFGRVVHHSAMGRVKAKLSRLSQAVVVDRFAPTTKLCPQCGSLNELPLSQRQYSCLCGYSKQRDIHAAQNVLLLATVGGFEKTPAERGGAPVDRKTTAADSVGRKSCRGEAGNTTTYKQAGSTSSEAAAETRLSSAVA